jgi:hypothetical protein
MKNALLSVPMCALALSACAALDPPAWLQTSPVNMRAYRSSSVALAPVEVNPRFVLQPSEQQVLTEQVTEMIAATFDLSRELLVTLAPIESGYPTSIDALQAAADAKGAAGVAVASVFALERDSSAAITAIGLRISFTDATSRIRTWTFSRLYQGQFSLDPLSDVLRDAVLEDLETVRDNLALPKRALGVLGEKLASGIRRPRLRSLRRGPELTVAAPRDLTDGSSTNVSQILETRQSVYPLALAASDDSGLSSIYVANRRTNFEARYDLLPKDEAQRVATKHFEDSIDVPLRVGRNKIIVSIQNAAGEVVVRRVSARRTLSENIYVVGVALDRYEEPSVREAGFATDLDDLFRPQPADSPVKMQFLSNQNATRAEVLTGVTNLGRDSFYDDGGLVVFYFAGRVERAGEKQYLVTYDSDADFIAATGIETGFLKGLLGRDDLVIMDLCERDAVERNALRETFPTGLLSFTSCGEDRTLIASEIRESINDGDTLKRALEQVPARLSLELN